MEPGINRGDEKIWENMKLARTFKNAYGLKKQIPSPSPKNYCIYYFNRAPRSIILNASAHYREHYQEDKKNFFKAS